MLAGASVLVALPPVAGGIGWAITAALTTAGAVTAFIHHRYLKGSSVKKIALVILAGVLALAGPALAPTPATALGAAGSTALAAADSRCPEQADICTYRLPDHIQAARDACYRTEAAARRIPSEDAAYRAWWTSATTQQRADWTQAFRGCQDRHQLPGGTWDWESMIFVGWR